MTLNRMWSHYVYPTTRWIVRFLLRIVREIVEIFADSIKHYGRKLYIKARNQLVKWLLPFTGLILILVWIRFDPISFSNVLSPIISLGVIFLAITWFFKNFRITGGSKKKKRR